MALRYHERSVSHTTRAALQNTILTAHSNGKASAGQCVHPPVLQGKKRCLNEGWTPSASTAALGPAPNQLPAPGDAPFCSFLLLQAQHQKQAWPPIACIPKAFCGFIQYKHPTSFTFLPPSHTAENVYVKMFTNSPSLVCMDLSLSQEEIIDPKYSWTGPDGRNLEGERLSAAHAGFPLFSHCLSHCFQSTHSEGCSGVETAAGGGAGNQGKRGRKPTQLSLRGEKLSANS